jgi:uncharacterized metal-binding protein YceD (DUF177 family)
MMCSRCVQDAWNITITVHTFIQSSTNEPAHPNDQAQRDYYAGQIVEQDGKDLRVLEAISDQ